MTSDFDPPTRLSRADDAAARTLLRSALTDAPSGDARSASIARVLTEHRQRRARRGLVWAGAGAGAAIAVAAALALWLRPKAPAEVLVAREQRSAPSALVRGAALPPPSASAPAIPPELQACTPAVRAAGGSPLIDDFEDGDTRIAVLEHRAGFWSSTSDGTGTQWPSLGGVLPMSRIPGGRGSSQFGIHVRGTRFTKWGVILSTDLSARRCYDASVYGGVAFWMRGKGRVDFIAKMTQIAPEEYGGSCTHDCYDGHHVTIELSSTWQEHRVPWADLKQKGFGQAVPFDPRSLLALELTTPPEQTPYDYWLDDMRFLER